MKLRASIPSRWHDLEERDLGLRNNGPERRKEVPGDGDVTALNLIDRGLLRMWPGLVATIKAIKLQLFLVRLKVRSLVLLQ